jgi:hypothetical protein
LGENGAQCRWSLVGGDADYEVALGSVSCHTAHVWRGTPAPRVEQRSQFRPSTSPVVSLRGSHPAVFLALQILAGMDETEDLDPSCSRADAVGDQEWRSRDA